MKLKIDAKKFEEIQKQSAEELDPFLGNRLPMPLVKLDPNQFKWPETFLVRSAKRVDEKVINYDTGWNKKDDKGNYITTGNHNVQLSLCSGDEAQEMINEGKNFKNLPVVSCTVKKDIPLEKFEDGLTLVKLVNLQVMLGMHMQGSSIQWDHIKLVCDDVEL